MVDEVGKIVGVLGGAAIFHLPAPGLYGEEAAGGGGEQGGRHVHAHRTLEGLSQQHLPGNQI
jgi:hypothetical protein